MKFLELVSLTLTPEATYEFLVQHNLIIQNPLCVPCQRVMHLEKGKTLMKLIIDGIARQEHVRNLFQYLPTVCFTKFICHSTI
ncbi:hypothetical protein COBT_003842, partial [Conglomerata obtusa]